MHILYLHQHFSPPGAFGNNRSLELAENWVKQGHSVTIVSGSGNFSDLLPYFSLFKTYSINGIEVVRLNVCYSHFDSFSKRYYSFVKYLVISILLSFKWKKSTVVYASSTPLSIGLLALWIKNIYGIPFIFETVDLWPDVPIQMGILKNKKIINLLYDIENRVYHGAKHIICLSEGMKELIVSKNIESAKITVAHNGTNCESFIAFKDKVSAKALLKLQEEKFYVLYAGTIGEANGLRFLIDVALEIQNSNVTPIHFLILGNGNRKQDVKTYAENKNLINITFVNSVPKTLVRSYFDASDAGFVCFAPYSILETNSANKFFDYLASGIPVFINYAGWQSEYLKNYEAGFSEKTIRGMAQKIIHMSQNKSIPTSMGQNARQLALKHFNRTEIAQKILDKLIFIKSN